jgi:hypothetical protein
VGIGQRHCPEKLAGVRVQAKAVLGGAVGNQAAPALAKQDRRGVGRCPTGFGGPDGLSSGLIQCGHESLAPAGSYYHPRAIHEEALSKGPGKLVPSEPLEDIHSPQLLAAAGLESGRSAMSIQVIDHPL